MTAIRECAFERIPPEWATAWDDVPSFSRNVLPEESPTATVWRAGGIAGRPRRPRSSDKTGLSNGPLEEPASAEAFGWVEQMYSHVAASKIDEAVDILFDHIDELLLAGDFSACDDLLHVIDPKRLDTHLLVAALSMTKAAAPRLSSRVRFVNRVTARLKELAPDRWEALVQGLA